MEKRKTDRITLWQELKSLYSSLVGITLNQPHYMEDEYERASWRRVGLTIFIGMFIATVIVQIFTIIIYVQQGLLTTEYFVFQRELFFRLWGLGTGIIITFILVYITGYIARKLLVDEEYEVKIYPFVSYVQMIAVIRSLYVIFVTLFRESGLLMLRFSAVTDLAWQSNDVITTTLTLAIRVIVSIYLYFLLSRMLKIHFEGFTFWLRFGVIVLCFEGLNHAIYTWIAPIILNPIYRILYQSVFS